MVKLQIKPNGQAVITVPTAIRKSNDWEQGQELEWKLNNNGNYEVVEASEK